MPPDTRAAILDILWQRGGAHKSLLCRLTKRGWGTIGHHVHVLAKAGLVETEVHGRFLWVFLPGISRNERDWLVATHVPARRQILDLLGLRRTTIGRLSEEMSVSKKVIRTHLSHLRRAGAVAKVSDSPPTYEPVREAPLKASRGASALAHGPALDQPGPHRDVPRQEDEVP